MFFYIRPKASLGRHPAAAKVRDSSRGDHIFFALQYPAIQPSSPVVQAALLDSDPPAAAAGTRTLLLVGLLRRLVCACLRRFAFSTQRVNASALSSDAGGPLLLGGVHFSWV